MARPLSKTFDRANPFVVVRDDQEDGSIIYEVWDSRPDSYRRLCVIAEDPVEESELDDVCDRGQTKRDADMIATALNMIYGDRAFRSASLHVVREQGG